MVKGYINNYLRISQDENIIITCTKENDVVNGSMGAFVNTILSTTINCLHYYGNYIGDDKYCMAKQFIYNLEPDRSSYLEVSCRFSESYYENFASLIFMRLCKFIIKFNSLRDLINLCFEI